MPSRIAASSAALRLSPRPAASRAASESKAVAKESSRALMSDRRLRRDAILDPGVAVLFQLQGQFRSAALDHATVGKHVRHVGLDVVEQALVVGDDQERAAGIA